jgi:hypothetical protein
MRDIVKFLLMGWSVLWGMCILSFSIFQGGQLFMLFVIGRDPWSIPVSFVLIWLVGCLLIIGIPYTFTFILRKKSRDKQEETAGE